MQIDGSITERNLQKYKSVRFVRLKSAIMLLVKSIYKNICYGSWRDGGFCRSESYFVGEIFMLKSCKYCGRIHEDRYICEQKSEAEKRRWNNRKRTKAMNFRKKNEWKMKSRRIRQRDRHSCLCCLENLPGTYNIYNSIDLSVHHITPIEEDYSLRLDDENLITVCEVHHEMCEAGKISRDTQRNLVRKSIDLYENQ